TAGNGHLYALTDLPTSGAIESVTVTAVGWGAGNCDSQPFIIPRIYLSLKSGGTVYPSASKNLDCTNATAPTTVSNTWTTNPATGQAWTLADVNALEAGVQKYTGSSTSVTQLYVSVKLVGSATYAYNNGASGMDELTSMTRGGITTTFAYDANGNLRSRKIGSTSWLCYAWGADGLLSTATSIAMTSASCDSPTNPSQVQAYAYDGLGRRVKVDGVAGSGAWTVSIVAGMDVIFEKTNTGALTRYVYATGARIARIDCTGNPPTCTTSYYLADALGSTRQIRKGDRTQAFSAEYEPFGRPYNVTGTESYKY